MRARKASSRKEINDQNPVNNLTVFNITQPVYHHSTPPTKHINHILTHGHSKCHTGSSMVSLRKGVEHVAVCDTCVGENRHSSRNCLSRVIAPFIDP